MIEIGQIAILISLKERVKLADRVIWAISAGTVFIPPERFDSSAALDYFLGQASYGLVYVLQEYSPIFFRYCGG